MRCRCCHYKCRIQMLYCGVHLQFVRPPKRAGRRQLSGLVFAAGRDRNFQWDTLSDKNLVCWGVPLHRLLSGPRDIFMYRMFTLKVKNMRFITGRKEIHCSLNLIMIVFIRSLWTDQPFIADGIVQQVLLMHDFFLFFFVLATVR